MIVLRNSELHDNCDLKHVTNIKKSRYNIWKKYNDGYLMINTNSNAIVFFDKNEFDKLKKIEKLSADFKRDLLELGIVVSQNFDEIREIKEDIRSSAVNSQNADIFTIYPTQKCNANCSYCFEKDEEKIEMSAKVEQGVIDYLKRNIKVEHKTIIRWFGGEPLLASKIIDDISKELKFAGYHFNAMITTNAILLTPDLIKKAKQDWNIKSIHLTIDGYEETHGKRKGIISPHEYEKLLKNIKCLLENKIAVVCRINIDKNNEDQLELILDDLRQFSREKNLLVDIAPLRGEGREFFLESEYAKLYAKAYEKLCAANLINNICDVIPKRLHENCVACVNNSIIINARGNLFKCVLHSTEEENRLGTIFSGITEENKIWLNTTIREECEQCKLLPVCFGGCIEFSVNESSKGVPCRKIKYYLEEGMDQIYQHFLKNDEMSV